MATQIGLTVLFLFAFIILLVFNEIIYRSSGLESEITRKFAHVTATLSTISFPYLFNSHWYVLALAIIFFVLLFLSQNRSYLKSIHAINRISAGSYLLPVAIYLTFLVSYLLNNSFLFVLPILVLAICDPVAGIIGVKFGYYNRKIQISKWTLAKTWAGSISFFISCFIICMIALYINQNILNITIVGIAIIVSLTSTLAEMFSRKGYDNLTVPLSVLLVLLLLL